MALDHSRERLFDAIEEILSQKRGRLQLAVEKLNALNPMMVLQRGYSVLRRKDGPVICRAQDVGRDEELEVLLQEGRLDVVVTKVEKVRPG